MNSSNSSLWQRTLFCALWNDFRLRWKFKFDLPALREVTLEGVRLDVSALSPIMKNNLLEGRYEVQERTLAAKYLTASDAVLEVGGAIGFIGLFCQCRLGITLYTTVEANPETAGLLITNYALNGRTPALWNLALAKEDGTVMLNTGNEFWENSLVTGAGSGRTVEVPALTLPSIIVRLPYPPSALIIDIECAEQFVDFRQIPASVKKIIIELHPAFIGFPATYQIVTDLVNLGFRVEEESGGTFLFLRE